MSDTPKLADECKKLLDNDRVIVMWKNPNGSYTAAALSKDRNEDVRALKAIYVAVGKIDERNITDDFEPSQVLYRLTEKATTGRIA